MYRERKHIRLRNFDYSSENLHFITICTNNRECFFGEILDKKMILSPIGNIANLFWTEIPNHFPHVVLDGYIIMPNHVHGIIRIGSRHGMTLFNNKQKKFNKFGKPVPGSVSVIINHYKSAVKRWCNKNGHEKFGWQPRFYDNIINNQKDLERIRNYIISNPERI